MCVCVCVYIYVCVCEYVSVCGAVLPCVIVPNSPMLFPPVCSDNGRGWQLNVSARDGEELSIKLIVASIETLRSKLERTALKDFQSKTVLSGLRRLSAQAGGINQAMTHLR